MTGHDWIAEGAARFQAALDSALAAVGSQPVPVEGVTRCECGCKYWEDGRCIDCGDRPPS